MTNTPVGGDGFDLSQFEGMAPLQMMLAIRAALEFKMPPVGECTATAFIGGTKFTRVTWRCEREGCWYICTPRDPSNLEYLKNQHWHGKTGDQCPTPPRRESLPSGLAEIEKLWREIDDVVKVLKSDNPTYRGMSGPGLNGYVKGLAFSVVMKDHELWPDITAVSREALRRYRMHRGEIPYETTPTRHTNNFSSFQNGGWKSDGSTKPPAAPYKATTKPAKKAATPVKASLTGAQVTAIKAAKASGMFSDEDMATMYGATVAQIQML